MVKTFKNITRQILNFVLKIKKIPIMCSDKFYLLFVLLNAMKNRLKINITPYWGIFISKLTGINYKIWRLHFLNVFYLKEIM